MVHLFLTKKLVYFHKLLLFCLYKQTKALNYSKIVSIEKNKDLILSILLIILKLLMT